MASSRPRRGGGPNRHQHRGRGPQRRSDPILLWSPGKHSSSRGDQIDLATRMRDKLVEFPLAKFNQVCEQTYAMAQNLDPSSEGRGVLQSKTSLASVIKQKLAKKDVALIDRQNDIKSCGISIWNTSPRRVDDLQREQERLRESGTFSTEMGAMAVEMRKVYATLRALLDVLEILVGQSPTDRLGRQILEIKKTKRSDAALPGELMLYNIVPLDAPSSVNIIGLFPEFRAATSAIRNSEDLPRFPYDAPQLRQKDIFDFSNMYLGSRMIIFGTSVQMSYFP